MTRRGVHPGALAGGNARGDRRADDFYPTCDAVTAALIEAEGPRWRELGGRLVEPAAGQGHMVLPLRAAGFDVAASDLVDRGFQGCEIRSWYDWTVGDLDGRLVVTNPPFIECNDDTKSRWIRHARAIGVTYMALMLPIQWGAPDSRQSLFRDCWRPARKIELTFRPDWTGSGSPTAYVAWFIWDGERSPDQPLELSWAVAPPGASLDLSGRLHGDNPPAQGGLFDV